MLRTFALAPFVALAGFIFSPPALLAASFPLPDAAEAVVGQPQQIRAKTGDTLADIARRFDLGFDEIVRANPGVDPWLPGEEVILLPTRYILPRAPRRGIVVNLAEMRLYFYPPVQGDVPRQVITYPVSIGRLAWETPLVRTRVVAKEIDPVWRPPISVRVERAAIGEILPHVVPPGPDNPLGRFALRLEAPGYLIHGTNKPFGIGMRVTHGCLRLYPEDIEELFAWAKLGETVQIVNQPFKAGWQKGKLYLEAHAGAKEGAAPMSQAVRTIVAATRHGNGRIDWQAVRTLVRERRGLPLAVMD